MSTSIRRLKPMGTQRGSPGWMRAFAIAATAVVAVIVVIGPAAWLFRDATTETVGSISEVPEEWTTWTDADGLVNDCLCQMAMAIDGSIWVVGFDGISRFDGTRWERLEPPRPFTGEGWPAVAPAPDGSVWISGMDYLAQYVDEAWEPAIEAGYGMDEGDPLSFQGLRVDDDGRVWTNRNDEDGVIRNGAFVPMSEPEEVEGGDFTPPEGVGILTTAPNGSIWMGVGDSITGVEGALIEYDGERFVAYNLGGVREAVFEADGTGWFLVNEVGPDAGMFGLEQWSAPGLYRFEDGDWYRITTDDGLAGFRLGEMLHAPDGALWLSTGDGTVTRYQPGTDPRSGTAVTVETWPFTDTDWPPPAYPPTTLADGE